MASGDCKLMRFCLLGRGRQGHAKEAPTFDLLLEADRRFRINSDGPYTQLLPLNSGVNLNLDSPLLFALFKHAHRSISPSVDCKERGVARSAGAHYVIIAPLLWIVAIELGRERLF